MEFNYDEVDLLKGAIAKYKGDLDDPKQSKLAEELRIRLLEQKGILRPS